MKKTIALIIPPSPFLANERVFPSLGILKVAAVLEKAGYPLDVLDLSGIGNFEEVFKAYLETNDVEKICLTATTPQFPYAAKLGEIIRDYKRHSILGGPHATMVNSARKKGDRGLEAYKQMMGLFDTVVAGDGEIAIFEAIKKGGLVDADKVDCPMFMKKGTLEQYPFPARHLIDLESYHYTIDGLKAQSMISQLGCPFECGFCGGRNTPSFRVARARSAESVVNEVDVLVGLGYKGIMFYDDELNVNEKNLNELLEALIKYQKERSLDLRFRGFVRADLFNQKQADLMYKAGFRIILSGVESGSDKILTAMHKRTTKEMNTQLVRICHQAGLKVKALMSLGHPGESIETVAESMIWALKTRPDDIDWTVITQYPGSPYFDESVPCEGGWVYIEPKTGSKLYSRDIDYTKEAGFYKGIPGEYTSFVWTDYLSPEQLVERRNLCEEVLRENLGLDPIKVVEAKKIKYSGGKLPDSILRSTNKSDII